MCGIAGIWSFSRREISREDVENLTDSIRHRGPDASGTFIDNENRLGLGHRRLSILDVSPAANQPMVSPDGNYVIVYNGEIFNFIEIRRKLINAGFDFRTDTDTEVILAAFMHWGEKCLDEFNGMWAFAIWDKIKKQLFLARDRFGIKPCYYYFSKDNCFAFASETIAFKNNNLIKRSVNDKHLQLQLNNNNALEGHGHTIFENVFQLLPGHFMYVTCNNDIRQQRWWKPLENLYDINESYPEQVERFRELFFDSCRLRLRSDVPLASALSGGLDSSSVYSTLHYLNRNNKFVTERMADEWQTAFVAVFPGTIQDEREYAEKVVEYSKGKAVYINPEYGDLTGDLLRSTIQYDAISSNPVLSAGHIYRSMKTHGITVSMDGHGVDELMYGYESMVHAVQEWYRDKDPEYSRSVAEILNSMSTGKAEGIPKKQVNKNIFERIIKKFRINSSVNKEVLFNDLLISPDPTYHPEQLSDTPLDFSGVPKPDAIALEAFYITLLPKILANFDRASMQHSIEVRMPFMDYRLVTYIQSLPMESKLGGGYTKRILRDAMKDIIPEDVRTRTGKTGLNLPLTEWFNNVLRELLEDMVNSSSFRQSPHWNGEAARNFVIQKFRTKEPWTNWEASRIWMLINAKLILD